VSEFKRGSRGNTLSQEVHPWFNRGQQEEKEFPLILHRYDTGTLSTCKELRKRFS